MGTLNRGILTGGTFPPPYAPEPLPGVVIGGFEGMSCVSPHGLGFPPPHNARKSRSLNTTFRTMYAA